MLEKRQKKFSARFQTQILLLTTSKLGYIGVFRVFRAKNLSKWLKNAQKSTFWEMWMSTPLKSSPE